MKIPQRRTVRRINFRILPPLDTVLMLEGQHYRAVGSKLHRKADGAEVPLIRWRSHCATCGEPFHCFTTLKARHPNRRCPKHHRPGVAVSAEGRGRQRACVAGHGPRKTRR